MRDDSARDHVGLLNHLNSMDRPDSLRLLQILADVSEKEADRMWQRFSVMIAANTALLVTVTWAARVRIALIVVSISGFMLSVTLLMMMRLSKYYIERWHLDIEALVRDDLWIKLYFKGRATRTARIERPFQRLLNKDISASHLAMVAVVVFSLVWIALIAIAASGSLPGALAASP